MLFSVACGPARSSLVRLLVLVVDDRLEARPEVADSQLSFWVALLSVSRADERPAARRGASFVRPFAPAVVCMPEAQPDAWLARLFALVGVGIPPAQRAFAA